jgi:hypothetical protein
MIACRVFGVILLFIGKLPLVRSVAPIRGAEQEQRTGWRLSVVAPEVGQVGLEEQAVPRFQDNYLSVKKMGRGVFFAGEARKKTPHIPPFVEMLPNRQPIL